MDPELYKAATSGSISLFSNSNLLQETMGKNSALHLAVKFNQKRSVGIIINLQPQLLYRENSEGDTPLHIAARLGNLEIIKLLTNHSNIETHEVEAHGELLSMVNLEKDTALHNAVRHGHLEIVELLIKKDPGLTQLINDCGESPLFLAVDRKYFSIATHILEASPTCSYQGRYNMNVLHAAVIRTQRSSLIDTAIEVLIRYLDNPLYMFHHLLTTVKLVWTPIRDELYNLRVLGRTESDFLSAFIQKCQTAITEADEFGWTPLHYSAYLCQPKATQLLLKYNISVAYMKDKDGMSALHIAAKEGHAIVMRELITICPQTCELVDFKGRTALHVAVESGKTSVIKYALMTRDLEGLINKQDKEGNTPLHLAAIHGHHDIANLLAGDRRVDKRAMNKEGLTSIEIISTMELRRCERAWITMKLVLAGALPSLKGVVYGDNTKTKLPQHVESKEPAEYQEKRHTALDRKGEPRENKESKYHRLKDISNTHLLVATIIATVTFAAGFTMPGGYESQGSDQGKAILGRKSAFISFLIVDTIAFCCSAASMLMHFWASLHVNYNAFLHFIQFASALTYYSIIGMVTAFISGTNVVLAESSGVAIANLAIGCCFFFAVFFIWILG